MSGVSLCESVPRFDVDFTEVHSYMTRGEAILQSPEFSLSRKDGSVQELHDKVQVKKTTWLSECVCLWEALSAETSDAEIKRPRWAVGSQTGLHTLRITPGLDILRCVYAERPVATALAGLVFRGLHRWTRKMGKGRSLVQEIRQRGNNEFIVRERLLRSCFLSTFVLQTIKFTPLGDLLNSELLHV